ncbi:MAG: ABC transporter substrate-binding protein [Candidatus Nanopelagicales bacterium]
MAAASRVVIGQFSESAVVLAARELGLDRDLGLDLVTTRVPSSPGQFAALSAGELDLVVTSPDNVLLYATTDAQPLGERQDVRMLRTVDRGLGLALVTRPDLERPTDLVGRALGVDVIRSGFALLLFAMLDRLGVDRARVEFPEHGATPRRLEALLDGRIDGTILNAESRVRALDRGQRAWVSSVDVSPDYLGTVLAARADVDAGLAGRVVRLWDEATAWLLGSDPAEVGAVLARSDPTLGSPAYVALLRDDAFGLLSDPVIRPEHLAALVGIRRACGAYAPEGDLAGLVGL